MNKPLAITKKPFRAIKANTSKERSFYTQGQQYVGGMLLLFIVCLFTSCNTGKPGAPTEYGEATVPPGVSIPTPDQAQVEEQQESKPPLVEQLRSLALDLQIDQHPDKLAEIGGVLLELAASKQEEAGDSAQGLSLYTDAAILYQHVLSICEQKMGTLCSQEASALAQSAYQGLAQIQASMLARAKGAAPQAITVEKVKARIRADKQRLEAIRTKAREEADRLAKFRDQQGSAEEVRGAETVYIEGSKKLFADIAGDIKSVLGNFYQEAEQALGPPPCQYAIMGVGSIALQQTTPYSDLEFAILMEDAPNEDEATAEAWRAYFRKLTHLVHFRVINLGETVLPFSEYKISLDHLGRKGLNFDLGGKTPLGRKDKDYELIQPVEGMMEYLKNKDNKMEQMDKLLPFVLERTCYIYGDQGLHDAYLAAQREFWTSCQDAAGKHAYQERMRKKLLEGVSELDHSQPGVVRKGREQPGDLRTVGPKLHPEDAGRLYDVKQEIYRLPDRLLYGLATYYGLRPESAWDAVEQLKAQGIIGVDDSAKQAAHRLKYAVSFATMLRLATYIRYGQQKEDLAGSASRADTKQIVSELFALPKEALQEDGSLFKYYYTALALHSEMSGFFKVLHLRSQLQSDRELHRMLSGFSPGGKYTAGKEKEHFSSFGFYDTSCAVKIAIYNRLLHYEQAAKCAEGHLEKVKAGYNQKKLARTHHNLGVSYYHLGRFDQSFDHFKISLELLEGLYPDGDPQVAAVLRSLGIAHYNLSEFQESLGYFERSLKMLQGLYQEKNPETAQALSSVGAAHEQLKSFEASLEYKQQALKMLQALYPDKDPEVARALLSLGDTYAAMGQLEASLDHKKKSLKMFKDLYGKSHPEVARALLSLGESYALDRKLPESLEHKQEALAMSQNLYGSSHPEVARALLSLGESYTLSEKLEELRESEELKEQSWKMFQSFYDATHPEVVRALGSLNEARGRLIEEGESSRKATRHALRPVRTAHPQHLALLSTPRHGKEAPEENTLLRNYYQDDTFAYVPSLFEEHRSRHVKDLQCQLMLREKKRVKEGKEQAGGSNEENQVASHHIRIEEVKTPIELQDLFKDRSVHPDEPVRAVQRILLTGDPGTGKTTVSKKLAYLWSQGQWGQAFHTLYLLPVRGLQQSAYDGKDYDRKNTLSTAIVNICFAHDLPTEESEYNRLRKHIEQELEKPTTLVILDGLDERAGASKEILSKAQDQTARHKLLMLSRPYGIDTERSLANIEIDHRGFNDDQLKAYVLAEVPDGKLAAELIGYIQQHTNIREIAHIPVNLQILCALWQDERYGVDREELEQGSLPVLYREFTEYTWRRYKERTSEGVSFQGRDALFAKLGQIALAALEQGEVLISPGLIKRTLSKSETDADEVKTRCKDAGFLLLSYVGKDQDKQESQANQSGFYQFPHLTFQEYFAGRHLARKLFSGDEREKKRTGTFLSEHKYEGQYGRTLSFMAGDVSRIEEIEGIRELLSLLGEGKEIVGLQHLRLQLRVVHEWLCVAPEREAGKGMAELEEEFQVLSSLEEWFVRAFAHIRLEGYGPNSTGRKLLELLTSSLQTFGSVSSHAPALFELLKKEAKDPSEDVREASLEALSTFIKTSPERAQEVFALLEKALKDELDYVRKAALEALSSFIEASSTLAQKALPLIQEALKDTSVSVRAASLEALSTLLAASPAQAQEALSIILEGYKDTYEHVRQAAFKALSKLLEVSLDRAPQEGFKIIQAALKDTSKHVRQAFLEALSTLVKASPERAQAALSIILEAHKDTSEHVRQAALEALSTLIKASPERAQAALPIILEAHKDTSEHVRQAALEALSKLFEVSPAQVQEVLPLIQKALKDTSEHVRQAAQEALSKLFEVSLDRAPQAGLPIILEAYKDTSEHVRQAALEALSKLFEVSPAQAQAGLPIILEAYKDTSEHVRQAALEALSKLFEVSPAQAQAGLPIILEAHKDTSEHVRQVAFKALSKLFEVSLDRAPQAGLPIILEAHKDTSEHVRQAAFKALSKLFEVSLDRAPQAGLPIILEAYKDTSERVRQASLEALSTLIKASPERAQAGLPIILEAHKDTSEHVRQAAQEALYTLLEVSPAQVQEVLPLIQKALKDTSEHVRQAAFKALSKLLEVSPAQAQEALSILLAAAEDENEGVRQTALDALLRASLEQLLESYWSSKDASLIPYITPRLYETPVVVGEVLRGFQQVTLYATAGNPRKWQKSQEVVGHFKERVNDARQIGETTTDYDGGLSKRAKGLWQRYFGEVSAAPPLPDDIVQIMESPCPFWKGKQVKDTHLLALIPSRVGGQPLTLDYLGELIKSPKGGGPATQYAYYWDEARKAIGNQSSERSYWVLMTRDVLDGSRDKSYQDQCALVADHANRTGLAYEVPGALEAAVVMLLHHVRSGERLYSDKPLTYTRCRERLQNYQLVVGGFSSGGLDVFHFLYDYTYFGVAGLRKF